MENQVPPNANPQSDEIDLGQLFQMIGRGFKSLFKAFLRFFVYIKRSIIKLGILGILGLVIGFGLNQIVSKKLKTEVIVKPNLESKNYLYDVVNEIQANVKAKNDAFFEELEINVEDLKGFEVTIEPVSENQSNRNIEDEMKYLELLQNFENIGIVSDVIRAEILNNSSLNHRVTFFYKDAVNGRKYAKKLMAYINTNDYFRELIEIHRENAKARIQKNNDLIIQIDQLITEYSKKMAEQEISTGEGRIVLDNEEKINITGLFDLKNNLIRDTERKKLELKERNEAIQVINFGKTQEVQKSFFGKNIILIPVILIVLYFLVDIFKLLDRRAKEIELQ